MSSILIIGAGMAGLTAACELTRQGHTVTVLDKGRGVGGRLATRRIDASRADHGAQYIEPKTSAFHDFLETLRAEGVVSIWPQETAPNGFETPRYVGKQGMSSVAKHLARGLTVHTEQRVIRTSPNAAGWEAQTEAGEVFRADALIITVPAPQALALLQESNLALPPADRASLEAIRYRPCIAVMATLSQPSAVPAPGYVSFDTGDVAWLTDTQQKGVAVEKPSVTVHASADFSRRYFDENLQAAGRQLLQRVRDYVMPDTVETVQVHRWRYSQADRRHAEPFLRAQTAQPLLFGGDGFGPGQVEGAWLSGMALARAF